jgi:LmbE family N-acetylglucosaminyl deacetylase
VRAVAAIVALALVGACATPATEPGPAAADRPPEVVHVTGVADGAAPRVLCVVAHPDDEIAFAGTLYKTATFLGGACDVFTVTNGEAGFKYATLAERLYGAELTDEEVGRRELPEIRKAELTDGCRTLGVRDIHFLREKDHRYTQDVDEVLPPGLDRSGRPMLGDPPMPGWQFAVGGPWDLARVARQLDRRLAEGRYDFVLVHLPTQGTHAHHVAATVMAAEAVARMPADTRPAVLGARVVTDGEPPAPLADVSRFDAVRIADGVAPFVFDRRQTFGHQRKLDYRVVVNWAIAAHRSQGTMQLLVNRGDREEYLLLDGAPPGAADRARAWFESLSRPQFRERVYGASAGTNR